MHIEQTKIDALINLLEDDDKQVSTLAMEQLLLLDDQADDLVKELGQWSPLPTTYAGGVRNLADLLRVRELGQGRLDATIGSALDIFGGSGITYAEAVAFNQREAT